MFFLFGKAIEYFRSHIELLNFSCTKRFYSDEKISKIIKDRLVVLDLI